MDHKMFSVYKDTRRNKTAVVHTTRIAGKVFVINRLIGLLAHMSYEVTFSEFNIKVFLSFVSRERQL